MLWFWTLNEEMQLVPLGDVEDFATYFACAYPDDQVFALYVSANVYDAFEQSEDHHLAEVNVFSKMTATYTCSCGAVGTASMAEHLGSLTAIEKRAIKNHEMHQVRALRRDRHNRVRELIHG